jgi:hypothetical protein
MLVSQRSNCKRREFLTHIFSLKGNGTISDGRMPQIDKAYESGKMPALHRGGYSRQQTPIVAERLRPVRST